MNISTTTEDRGFSETQQKIIYGLSLVREKLIAFKKSKNSPLIVMKDGKIVAIKPWEEEENSLGNL